MGPCRAYRSDNVLQMRFVDLSANPNYNVADDHLDDKLTPIVNLCPLSADATWSGLAPVQKVTSPTVELRGRNPDPSRNHRDSHYRPARLLNGLDLKCVRPENVTFGAENPQVDPLPPQLYGAF